MILSSNKYRDHNVVCFPEMETINSENAQDFKKALNEKALFMTGTSLYGVSLNDCVVSAQDTVEKTLAYLRSKND